MYHSQKPDISRGRSGAQQAHRQLLRKGAAAGYPDARHRGAQLLRMSDPLPGLHAVDNHRTRRERVQTRRGTLLQHPILLQDNGLSEFRDKPNPVQPHEFQVP